MYRASRVISKIPELEIAMRHRVVGFINGSMRLPRVNLGGLVGSSNSI